MATKQERIKAIEQQEERLKQRKRKLLASINSEERKKRTHRLIETGAVVEKGAGIQLDTTEQREALLDVLITQSITYNGREYALGEYIAKIVREKLDR